MRIKYVMRAAAVVLWMTTGQGEAQEIGHASRGLALAQRLCADCHAIQKEYGDLPMPMRLDSRLLRPRRA
jgi:cytochrome c2